MQNSSDWRLDNYYHYKDYFKDIENKFYEKRNFKSIKGWDHEHCEICFLKITDLNISEEHTNFGYVTTKEIKRGKRIAKQEHWICEKCFNDFKDLLGFKTKNEIK